MSVRGVSDALFKLVYELMLATGGVAILADLAPLPLLTWPGQAQELPDADFGPPVVCSSWRDVEAAMERGFSDWEAWAELEEGGRMGGR